MANETPTTDGVVVEPCATLEVHIFARYAGQAGFDWDNMHGHDVHDLDSLIEALWVMYGEPICKGDFSRDKGDPVAEVPPRWRPFTPDERSEITKIRAAAS